MSRRDFQYLSDEALLDHYHATRNLRAFRHLYARHKDGLYRYCVQMNPAAADSLLEALWHSLLERPPELRGRLLRSWLYIRINHLLRNRPAADPDVARQAVPRDNRLLAAIQQLPKTERNILLLHTECQLPLATVADIEKISLKRCKALYQNGKERLQEMLHGSHRQPWPVEEVKEVTV